MVVVEPLRKFVLVLQCWRGKTHEFRSQRALKEMDGLRERVYPASVSHTLQCGKATPPYPPLHSPTCIHTERIHQSSLLPTPPPPPMSAPDRKLPGSEWRRRRRETVGSGVGGERDRWWWDTEGGFGFPRQGTVSLEAITHGSETMRLM